MASHSYGGMLGWQIRLESCPYSWSMHQKNVSVPMHEFGYMHEFGLMSIWVLNGNMQELEYLHKFGHMNEFGYMHEFGYMGNMGICMSL